MFYARDRSSEVAAPFASRTVNNTRRIRRHDYNNCASDNVYCSCSNSSASPCFPGGYRSAPTTFLLLLLYLFYAARSCIVHTTLRIDVLSRPDDVAFHCKTALVATSFESHRRHITSVILQPRYGKSQSFERGRSKQFLKFVSFSSSRRIKRVRFFNIARVQLSIFHRFARYFRVHFYILIARFRFDLYKCVNSSFGKGPLITTTLLRPLNTYRKSAL